MSRLSGNIHTIFSSSVIEILNSNQIFTTTDFVKADSKVIEKITKFPFKDILEVRKLLIEIHAAKPRNGLDYYKYLLENSALIPTGIKCVDELLNGGLLTGHIYELSGLPASGKTIFCLMLIKNVTANLKQNVYFLDTKYNFSGRKLELIFNGLDKSCLDDAMKKTLIKRINTKHELINSLFEIKIGLENGAIKLLRVIIIDSLPVLFLQNSSELADNNNLLNQIANIMHYIANEHQVTFLVTNLITIWNPLNNFSGDTFKETVACGKYWSTIPNVKLKIEKLGGNLGKITLFKNNFSRKDTTTNVTFLDTGLN